MVSIGALITAIVGLVILYWIIRTAVRDGILAAWRIRNRATKEDSADWHPLPGRQTDR